MAVVIRESLEVFEQMSHSTSDRSTGLGLNSSAPAGFDQIGDGRKLLFTAFYRTRVARSIPET